jgi:hypothetical protein
MTIRVYHRRDPRFIDGGEARVSLADFHFVALVETTDLDRAYERTNTIDRYWPGNEGVAVADLPPGLKGYRSTSVGDILEVVGAGFSMVSFIGFRSIAADGEPA